ncbi:hypothetical protein LSM04_004547 [Trypanosoma melophagium]|uniref:uncharacterized protein n=1 Tax=Trypanosoma melophagium TaxID=715481 RepID=UPI00351A9840|nr:hypothetical protein LSM04_004547 [Trypanosoma melophagium]
MANGAEVSIEYNNEYIVIRGSPPSRHMFMALLLHAVVKHINTTTGPQEPNPIQCNPHTIPFPQEQEEKEKEHQYILEGDDVKMREEMIDALRRAVKVELEKAEVARSNAERECTLKEALLRSERDAEMMMPIRRKRINTQQHDVRSSSIQENEEAQKQRKQRLHRSSAKSTETSVPRHDTYLDNLFESNASSSSSPLLLSSSSPEQQEEEGSGVSISRTPYRNRSQVKSVTLAIPITETRSAENDLILPKRGTELLRNEKKRLIRQVDTATSVAQQQRDRLQSIENVVNKLCRRVLNTSDVGAAIINETETPSATLNIWGKALLPHLILHRSNTGSGIISSSINSLGNSGVEEQRVRALVHSLNNSDHNSNDNNKNKSNKHNNDESSIEQQLTDLAVLLEIEHQRVRATLEFAVHERDAALQAQREEKLLNQGGTHTKSIIAPSQRYENTLLNDPLNRSVQQIHNNSDSEKLPLAALAKENVTLRYELQKCFDDIQQLAKVIEQSQAMQRELQEKLRKRDEHVRQKEERM